jgi:hypothetical protein
VAQEDESQKLFIANTMCGGTIRMDSRTEFSNKLENINKSF